MHLYYGVGSLRKFLEVGIALAFLAQGAALRPAFGEDDPDAKPIQNFAIVVPAEKLSLRADNPFAEDFPALDHIILPDRFPLKLPEPKLSSLESKPGELLLGICDDKRAAQDVAKAIRPLKASVREFKFEGATPGLCPEVLPAARGSSRDRYSRVENLKMGGLKWQIEVSKPKGKPNLPKRVRMSLWAKREKLTERTLRGAIRQPYESEFFGPNMGEFSEWEFYEAVEVGGAQFLLLGHSTIASDHGGVDCHVFAYSCGRIDVVIPEIQRFFGLPTTPPRCSSLKDRLKLVKSGDPLPEKIALPEGNLTYHPQECRYRFDES